MRNFMTFPNGNYKINMKIFDDIDDHIGSGKILLTVKVQGRDVEF
jgi:major membrane immunogen (membrane-anchored lipoprotein)